MNRLKDMQPIHCMKIAFNSEETRADSPAKSGHASRQRKFRARLTETGCPRSMKNTEDLDSILGWAVEDDEGSRWV